MTDRSSLPPRVRGTPQQKKKKKVSTENSQTSDYPEWVPRQLINFVNGMSIILIVLGIVGGLFFALVDAPKEWTRDFRMYASAVLFGSGGVFYWEGQRLLQGNRRSLYLFNTMFLSVGVLLFGGAAAVGIGDGGDDNILLGASLFAIGCMIVVPYFMLVIPREKHFEWWDEF